MDTNLTDGQLYRENLKSELMPFLTLLVCLNK